MRQSTEITRFLNHIDREQNKIKSELNSKISIAIFNESTATNYRKTVEQKLKIAENKIEVLENELSILKPANNSLLASVRSLLPKIRVNIYTNSKKCTPRWFKSRKWWSRETGGLDADFVATMSSEEIQEAVDFYGKTELPFIVPI